MKFDRNENKILFRNGMILWKDEKLSAIRNCLKEMEGKKIITNNIKETFTEREN